MYCEPIRTETTVEVEPDDESMLSDEHARIPADEHARIPADVAPAVAFAEEFEIPACDLLVTKVAERSAAPLAPVATTARPESSDHSPPSGQVKTPTARDLPDFAVADGCTLPPVSKFDRFVEAGWRLALLSISSTAILSYFFLHSLTGYYFWQITGTQHDDYMSVANPASGVGVMTALICAAAYYKAFIGIKPGRVTWILRLLLAIFVLGFGALSGGWTGGLCGLGICAAFALMSWLGGLVHTSMPTTFRFKRAIMLNGLAVSPFAIFVLCSIASVSSDSHSFHRYSNFDAPDFGLLTFFTSVLLGFGTYAVARTARTDEALPLMMLGALHSTPLLFGFLMQVIIMATLPDGVPMAFAGLATIFTALGIIGGSAALGAKINGFKHNRKMAKAGVY